MDKIIEGRLQNLNISLDYSPEPGGKYTSVNIRENIAYVAIQFPIQKNNYLYQGRLGNNISTAHGYEAAQLCAVNILAQMHKYVGFERIIALNHLAIYYQQGDNWDDGPSVADVASDLFIKALAEKGVHSRAIFGVQHLPRNFSVGIVSTFTIRI